MVSMELEPTEAAPAEIVPVKPLAHTQFMRREGYPCSAAGTPATPHTPFILAPPWTDMRQKLYWKHLPAQMIDSILGFIKLLLLHVKLEVPRGQKLQLLVLLHPWLS